MTHITAVFSCRKRKVEWLSTYPTSIRILQLLVILEDLKSIAMPLPRFTLPLRTLATLWVTEYRFSDHILL